MTKHSRQRECIKEFLTNRFDHPTAETVYLNVKKEFPNISLGTVYRDLTAHERFCLVLLCSQPDTVHRFPLRKTQTSSPLIKGSPTVTNPGQSITPTIADCWYRAPLPPRLLGDLSIACFRKKVNIPQGLLSIFFLQPFSFTQIFKKLAEHL